MTRSVAEKRAERGIVLGGSGNGEAIAANRDDFVITTKFTRGP